MYAQFEIGTCKVRNVVYQHGLANVLNMHDEHKPVFLCNNTVILICKIIAMYS